MTAGGTAVSLTVWVTPFTEIPRRIPFFSANRHRQRLGNLLTFGLAPTLAFWAWFLFDVQDKIVGDFSSLRLAIPLAGSLITLAPLLMQHGEFMEEDLLAEFNREGTLEGWDLPAIQHRLNKIDRLYYHIVLPLGLLAAVALLASVATVDSIIPVRGGWETAAGLIVVTHFGLTAASGAWGFMKALAVIPAAAATVRLRWSPYRSTPSKLIDKAYSVLQVMGVIFSTGTLMIPVLLIIREHLSATSQVIVLIYVAYLFAGGLGFFTIPSIYIYRLLERHKEEALDQLAPQMEALVLRLRHADRLPLDEAARVYYSLQALSQVRGEMAAQHSLPPPMRTLTRSATTLVLPILIAVFQVVTAD
ncbi:hypothetical protein G5C60_19465 [Streptomyces sp. HC44]|uniref:Uncharacterized protein n=1 Tax=Streptomyces scabichelini TaxID=2711217 RepID=A0A6G4V796_9ACTN|nr:hypothetical protein [Streptomyces scabichelini]NGO09720.1 hypothetical protein [Streptomyces scabichelini]